MTKLCHFFLLMTFITISSCTHKPELLPITNYTYTPEKRLLSLVAQACPRLTNKQGDQGSGILIGKDGLIMTDLHVTDTDEIITIDFFKLSPTNNNFLEKSFTTTGHVVYFSDPVLDFSLIKADALPPDITPLLLAPADALQKDQPVWRFGYNASYRWSYGYFVVAESEAFGNYIGKKMIIGSGPGSSGGPIVNGRGQVLGIVQRAYASVNTIVVDNGKRFAFHNPTITSFLPIDMMRGLLLKAMEEKSLKIEGF